LGNDKKERGNRSALKTTPKKGNELPNKITTFPKKCGTLIRT